MHLKPVRARLVTHVGQGRHTSHPAFVGEVPRPDWLDVAEHNALFGSVEAYSEYLADVVRGRDVIPEGVAKVQLEEGVRRSGLPALQADLVPQALARPLSVEEAWKRLEAVTGMPRTEIERRAPGGTRAGGWRCGRCLWRRGCQRHWSLGSSGFVVAP